MVRGEVRPRTGTSLVLGARILGPRIGEGPNVRALLSTRGAGIVLAVLAAACLVAGGVGAYADREIVDGARFSERAAAALDDEAVREVVAEEIVGEALTRASPDLLAVRPVLITAVEALTGSTQFRRLFALAVRDAHAVLVGERKTSLILDLDRAGGIALQALREASPAVAEQVPEDVDPGLAGLDESAIETRAARLLRRTAVVGWPVLALGLLLLGVSVLVAGDRRAQLGRAGMAITGAGAAVWAAVAVTGIVLTRHAQEVGAVPEERVQDAISGVWLALAGDLRTWAWVLGLFGLCISAIAARAVTPGDLVDAVRERAGRGLRSGHKGVVAARGAMAIATGVALLLRPEVALRLAALALGLLLVFVGVGELSSAVERRHVRRALGRPPSRAVVLARIGAMVAAIAVTAGVALALALPSSRAGREAAIVTSGCNGLRALCDRRLDEVVIPATHNAFSAAEEPGWLFANQRYGIERQLRDGIRGFLIDVHLGVRGADGRVRTDLRAEGSDRNRVASQLTAEALEVADRIAGDVGLGRLRGQREAFLCHTLCELGAEPVRDELRVLDGFLDEHPGEVVVLFVEPYVPPAVIERELRAAGLHDRLALLRRDRPLPTLGQLVRDDRRVVVLTEREGGTRPWYASGFAYVQDTPLGARRPSELSCAESRGEDDAPLLMVNHWIDGFPPRARANAAIGGAFLEERLRRCARRRGQTPNIVAVDFYDTSGVVDIARRLNRRRARP